MQVRVPLGGRKVRGFVTGVESNRPGNLKDILAVSGGQPIFDARLLQSLQWAAQHYLAPVSVVLDKAAPPTLPGPLREDFATPGPWPETPAAMRRFVDSVAKGVRRPAVAVVTSWPDGGWLTAAGAIMAEGLTCLVIVSTAREVARLGSMATELFDKAVVAIPDASGSPLTRAWEEANRGGRLVVGTPRAATWKINSLGLVIVVEEGRRAMKDRQTPTIHVRELMRTRSRIEGFGMAFVGPTPSVELIAAGAEIVRLSRPWGLVEVVDRKEDPPGGGFLSERAVTALRAVSTAAGRAFVFTHRRSNEASVRCIKCRALRRCLQCGSHVGNHAACPRCGFAAGNCSNCGGNRFEAMGSIPSRLVAEVGTRIGRDVVGEVESDRQVIVGTERDLAGLGGFDLAIAVDVDALLYGQNYRAAEEALRILARVVGSVGKGKGSRAILQTSTPESALIGALRRADPVPYLEGVLADRARNGFPPATEMMAIEVRSDVGDMAPALLEGQAGDMILGSVRSEEKTRWLLQGDLRLVKTGLRDTIQKLRDADVTVRVDVDPIDL